ncbi:Alkanesulfonates transport system permease protein [[Actinomadura] parvosata subsp. kistnae]|uniref:Nitrate ABC transporter permease n=1 Tax=[Actinomadura] parvosata subsp. kistnae TaxID=1909395 RepID=A0A1V0A791_9ACTN|nr:ABC transporter permease [Nonomuraea sp. ATCC 55076]AQZ66074.1 nitrate ABC transporter permease [Nonomuraea sp. ATCC 55076]SPL97556.1 Alkanesulfonates transport system permease protein [Actinomadura parvosata subsp. kistnae]
MKTLTRFLAVPIVLVVWELVTRAIGDTDFPPPTTIVTRMYELWFSGPVSRVFLTDDAIANILPSLGRMFGGWILAAVIGIAVGMLLGRSRAATDYVDPLIEFGRALPPPLLIPVFLVVTAGLSSEAVSGVLITQLSTIVFGVIWPVLLNSIDGVRAVDRTYTETARVFNLTKAQYVRVVLLPAASPKIFAGLRLSLSLALIMMVISELLGGSDGVGYQLLQAQRSFDGAGVWAAIALLGILGYVVNSLFVLAERRVLVWHRQATRNP